jgi:hypothetical protein
VRRAGLRGCALACALLLAGLARAAAAPAVATAPAREAWAGARVPFYVELRGTGAFVGSARFVLPELPGALLLKVGNPTVASQRIDGEDLFVQTHEFALFAQRAGALDLAGIEVTFASREGFDGPARELTARVPALSFAVRRPPGLDPGEFVVSTPSLEISESWEPEPATVRVGAVLRRQIVQRALDLPGMALAPASAAEPAGFRVYPQSPRLRDRLERGEFAGERIDTLLYVPERAGSVEIPALAYRWWDPMAAELRTLTLPAVRLEVEPAASSLTPGRHQAAKRVLLITTLALAAAASVVILSRRRLARLARALATRAWPAERRARYRLLRACARHDAARAHAAFMAWRNIAGLGVSADAAIAAALVALESTLYGRTPSTSWSGDELARALRTAARRRPRHPARSALPPLNPPAPPDTALP